MEVPSKPYISIRFATLRDIPTVTEIYTSAMCEDEVFDYICCYRDAFHDEHIFYYSQKLKGLLFEPRTAFMVAELHRETLDSEKEPSKQIISFAIWSLKGVHLQRNSTWQDVILRKVMHSVMKLEDWVIARLFGLRHDQDQSRSQAYSKLGDKLQKDFYDPYTRSYHLEVLGTSPDHRCKGAASALVKWATNAAVDGKVVVGTEPGVRAAGFYRKMGFFTVGQVFLDDADNPNGGINIPVARFSRDTGGKY